MRATEAAKNTSDLIEGTVQKIKAGSILVAETNDSFHAVSQSIEKMNVTVGEIAGSTKEQAIAIQQVNSAINQVDTITQQNAATAEETASASADLNSQVANIRLSVQDLLVMVGGKSGDGPEAKETTPPAEKKESPTKSLPAAKASAPRPLPQPQASPPPQKKKVQAQDVIPFDEQEFEDF